MTTSLSSGARVVRRQINKSLLPTAAQQVHANQYSTCIFSTRHNRNGLMQPQQQHINPSTTLSHRTSSFSSSSSSSSASQDAPPGSYVISNSPEAKEHYQKDPQMLARWLDVSIVKRKGRAFPADDQLLPAKDAIVFPVVSGTTLNGVDVVAPDQISNNNSTSTAGSSAVNNNMNVSSVGVNGGGGMGGGKKQGSGSGLGSGTVKLVCFSFKHYGFTLVRSWLDPFVNR